MYAVHASHIDNTSCQDVLAAEEAWRTTGWKAGPGVSIRLAALENSWRWDNNQSNQQSMEYSVVSERIDSPSGHAPEGKHAMWNMAWV